MFHSLTVKRARYKRSQCVRVPGNRVMSVHLCVSDRPEIGPCVVLKVQLVITERSHVNVSIGGKHHTWKLREVDNNRKAEKMNKWKTKTLTEEDIVAPVPLQNVGAGSRCSFIKLLQPMSFCHHKIKPNLVSRGNQDFTALLFITSTNKVTAAVFICYSSHVKKMHWAEELN